MGEFSITHILLVVFVFLIFFGPSKLPQLGQSLGKAIRGFKSGLSEIDGEAREIKNDVQENLQHDNKSAQAQKTAEPADTKKNS
jgi:TatA/E family protein of Tat protein translocase